MSTTRLVQPRVGRHSDAQHETELEKLYRVLVHNDDTTPYDFVILVLVRFFQLSPVDAELITWTAHTNGQAQVAILPLEEAQNRVGSSHFAAAVEGYPLTFTIEPE